MFWKRCAQKPRLWSSGLVIALPNCDVFGIVESQQKQTAIDIIIGGTEGTRRDCYALLQLLKEETLLKAETFSPGSDISELILSSRELSSLDWSQSTAVPEITYEKTRVEEAMEVPGVGVIRPRGVVQASENAHDLMVIPANHVRLMTIDCFRRFSQEMNHHFELGGKGKKYEALADRLGMMSHEIPSKDEANPTGCILQWWGQRSGRNTTDQLLAEVQAMGQLRAVDILEKELTLRPSIFPTAEDPEFEPNTKPDASATAAASVKSIDGGQQPTVREIESTLLEIAHCFYDMFDCEQLAVFLRISQGGDIIPFLRSINPHISPHQAAYEVLKTWREEKASTGKGEVLYRVLHEKLKMSAVASRFEDDLLLIEIALQN